MIHEKSKSNPVGAASSCEEYSGNLKSRLKAAPALTLVVLR